MIEGRCHKTILLGRMINIVVENQSVKYKLLITVRNCSTSMIGTQLGRPSMAFSGLYRTSPPVQPPQSFTDEE